MKVVKSRNHSQGTSFDLDNKNLDLKLSLKNLVERLVANR
jgi:hypothetical protein